VIDKYQIILFRCAQNRGFLLNISLYFSLWTKNVHSRVKLLNYYQIKQDRMAFESYMFFVLVSFHIIAVKRCVDIKSPEKVVCYMLREPQIKLGHPPRIINEWKRVYM